MPCYHPNKGFIVGLKDNGKKELVYCPYTVEYLQSSNKIRWNKKYETLNIEKNNLNKIDDYIYSDGKAYPTYYALDAVTMPCGQCIGCRIDKSRDWANRMMLEAQYYENNVFLTLTYDDEHIPVSEYEDLSTGEVANSYTLRKRDYQLFMKRLRRAVEVCDPYSGKVLDYSKIRFYAAGEYGSESLRPHYHAIIFNLKLDDLKPLSRSREGFMYFTSDLISKCWPFGYHLVSNVTWETCAYTARYIQKKLNGTQADFYKTFNIEPEFSLMSRRPGLGMRYYEDKGRALLLDETYIIRIATENGGLRFSIPKYFDYLFDLEYPDEMAEIKANRKKIAERVQELKLERTDLSYLDLLEVEKHNFEAKVNTLKRSDV